MKKSKIRVFAAKGMAMVMIGIMVLASASCGTAQELSMYSADPQAVRGESYPPASLDTFKAVASSYGEVYDMSETFGCDAAAVSGESVSLVYLALKDEAEAMSMALGDKDLEGVSLDVVSSGSNYDYYEEIYQSNEQPDGGSFYGLYLRVDNVLILISGPLADQDSVKAEAVDFYSQLGYPSCEK